MDTATLKLFAEQLSDNLNNNILPYWTERMTDPAGGFYGRRDGFDSLAELEEWIDGLRALMAALGAPVSQVDERPDSLDFLCGLHSHTAPRLPRGCHTRKELYS